LEVQDTSIIRFIVGQKFRGMRHVMLLIGVLLMLLLSKDVTQYRGDFRILKVMVIYVSLVAVCYVNINILVPVFFFKGRYLAYLILLVLLATISLATISNLLDTFFPDTSSIFVKKESEGRGFYESLVILIPIILVTTMVKLFQRWMRDSDRIEELNKLTYSMELNELRNQINPHFLFNMLNGIKSLVRSNPARATEVIMKLSEFLRYQLYENSSEHTLLRSEISFLNNFLQLEVLRRDNFEVKVDNRLAGTDLDYLGIPPNIFLIFVENAVKHSVDVSGLESYVLVTFGIEDNRLNFNCLNSVDPNYLPSADNNNSGLGLSNVKRRLTLLYGNDYTLEIRSSDIKYEILLTLPI